MLPNALHHLGIGKKMVHLMDTATFLLVFMMMGVLIVEITIFLTLLQNHTDTPHVVMVCHHCRQQHTHRCYPKAKYV
nr:hypothetical protein [uncultured Prevotella sp.]